MSVTLRGHVTTQSIGITISRAAPEAGDHKGPPVSRPRPYGYGEALFGKLVHMGYVITQPHPEGRDLSRPYGLLGVRAELADEDISFVFRLKIGVRCGRKKGVS